LRSKLPFGDQLLASDGVSLIGNGLSGSSLFLDTKPSAVLLITEYFSLPKDLSRPLRRLPAFAA
jgi:hypothetical protein